MKKLSLMIIVMLSYVASYAYMRPADPYMYDGPEVKEERAEGSAYVEPNRDHINSEYGKDVDNRQAEFRPDQDADKLFWSYGKQS